MIKLRKMRCAEHVARMEEMINAYKMLIGKPGGKMGGLEGVDLIHLAQGRDP
jgi:hypothetical protein